jgi:hypothetical protein
MSIQNNQAFANTTNAFWNTGAPDPSPLNSFIRKFERVQGGAVGSSPTTIATDSFIAPFSGTVVIVATASFSYTGVASAPVLAILLQKTTATTASASNQARVPNGGTESVSCILTFPITNGDNVGLNFRVDSDSATGSYSSANWVIYVCSNPSP